jgi:hypothetical protein
MSRGFTLFSKGQDDYNSRIMRSLLGQDNSHRPLSHREEFDAANNNHYNNSNQPNPTVPKRPSSANPLKRRLKTAQAAGASNQHNAGNHQKPRVENHREFDRSEIVSR